MLLAFNQLDDNHVGLAIYMSKIESGVPEDVEYKTQQVSFLGN